MNKEQLKKLVGTTVKIFPEAIFLDDSNAAHVDDDWFVRQVENGCVDLENNQTRHILRMQPDHIKGFTNDLKKGHGFLTLTVQVFVEGVNVRIEPITGSTHY